MRKGLPKSIIKKYGISKKAWRVFRRGKKKSRSSRKTKTTRRNKRGNPKNRGGRKTGKSLVRTAMKLARVGALFAPGIKEAMAHPKKPWVGLTTYGGVGGSGEFTMDRLIKAWTPYVATTAATHLISKLTGIIRRI